MAETSTPLLISVTNTPSPLALQVGVDPANSIQTSLEIEGTYKNPTFQENGSTLTAPEVGTPNPPLPSYLLKALWLDSETWLDSNLWDENNGSINLPFNHLTLPRLQNKASKVFSLNIHKTLVTINGQDYTQAFYSYDWASPINGVAQGTITLKETLGVSLNPEINGIDQGQEVTLKVKETPSSEELLVNCFVLGFPTFELNSDSTYELKIQIGDELALLSQTTRNRPKYCGLPPRTTRDLAQIYSLLNGLKTRIFPEGHDIKETTVNNFLTESPYEFLSKIYSPVNRDIRTISNGLIVAPKRKLFDDLRAQTLNYKDVIQSQNNFSRYYEIYTKVKASNDFPLELDFGFTTRTFTQVNGDPENTRPWFQGGYQEIKTTITSLGDTDIYSLKETFAYVPTESTPWAKALVDGDPCSVGGFTTIFDTIETEVKALTYYDHPSGTRIISKDETWKNGLKVFQIKDELDPNFEDYDLYNGILSYTVTTYNNIPQVNSEVCEKDYQLLSLNIRTENYELTPDFDYVFRSWSQENYSSSGVSFNLGQSSFTGVGVRWTRLTQTGEFSDEDNIWIIQPPLEEQNQNPPQARIIKAVVETITNFSEFSLMPGDVEPTPLSAPFCYNKEQLDTVSERYLREQFGLSKSIVIVVPFSNTLALNDSVYFTDRLGQTNKFLVWDIEFNCTLTQLTKTLTLLRWFE